MKSIFSELPHGLIIDIIRIENDRKKEELITKRKYNEVIKQINKFAKEEKINIWETSSKY